MLSVCFELHMVMDFQESCIRYRRINVDLHNGWILFYEKKDMKIIYIKLTIFWEFQEKTMPTCNDYEYAVKCNFRVTRI